MKCEAQTEAEMREHKVSWPQSLDELNEYIISLTERQHDYGTSAYAMSLAAVAAFNYIGHKLGTTGFQASCADLDIIRRTRLIDGPFMLLRGHDMLFPQYDLQQKLREAMDEWAQWASEEAGKLLAKDTSAHPNVIAHWRKLHIKL